MDEFRDHKNFVYGTRAVIEALKAGKEVEVVYIRQNTHGPLMTELRRELKLKSVPSKQLQSRAFNKLKDKVHFPNIIAPDVIIGCENSIPPNSGVIITPGNIITCNIKIGAQVVVNLGCTIGHDCVIEDFVTMSPGVNLSGYTYLMEGSYIGTGASTIERTTVGRWMAGCPQRGPGMPDLAMAASLVKRPIVKCAGRKVPRYRRKKAVRPMVVPVKDRYAYF